MIAIQLCLLATFAGLVAGTFMSEFRQFQVQFNKEYSSQHERQSRYAVFAANLAKINSHNSKPNISWTMGINQFTDMTRKPKKCPFYKSSVSRGLLSGEEFKAKVLMKGSARPSASGLGQGSTVPVHRRKMFKVTLCQT